MIALDEPRYFKFGMQMIVLVVIDYFAVEYEFIIITSSKRMQAYWPLYG